MLPRAILLGLVFLALVPGATTKADVTIESGPARTNLLELFTSEGCSSCPPAEEWFSTLRRSPRLWKDVVPIAFHINYWDDLGWTDALATPAFTDRQRTYAATWGQGSVYTPAMVLNGAEWRERDLNSIPSSSTDAGKLTATLRANGDVEVTFAPAIRSSEKWQAHAALLGFAVTSDVRAGENSGRRLVHDFVALALQDSAMQGTTLAATMHLPMEKVKSGKAALAVWITKATGVEPVQAAGGNL